MTRDDGPTVHVHQCVPAQDNRELCITPVLGSGQRRVGCVAVVEFDGFDLAELREDLLEPRLQWRQEPEMQRRHLLAFRPGDIDGFLDRAEGRAPADDQQVALGLAVDLGWLEALDE